MSFKQTDRVKVINIQHSKVGELGTVTHVYEDEAYVVVMDSGNHSGFFASELELFDVKREALIELAETLDKARKQANAINGMDGDTYRYIQTSMEDALMSLTEFNQTGQVLDAIVEDGLSVREALASVEARDGE